MNGVATVAWMKMEKYYSQETKMNAIETMGFGGVHLRKNVIYSDWGISMSNFYSGQVWSVGGEG